MTTGKKIPLTIQTFVGKVMAPLFNTLPIFVTAFFPGSKHLLIFLIEFTILSDFEAQENKICHCFTFSLLICYEIIGLDAMILVF